MKYSYQRPAVTVLVKVSDEDEDTEDRTMRRGEHQHIDLK
jgi:hypothetical protein